jgi:hypothetical protein
MTAGSSTEQAPQTLGGARRLRVVSAAIGLAVLVLLLAAAVIPLALAARQGVLYNVGQVATFLPIAAVGFLVAWHRPRNPIGWLLIVTAAGALLTVDGQLYAWLVYRLDHHLPFGPAALLLAFAWLTNFVTLPLAILLFPDGVLPARWRWVLWAYVAVSGFLVVSEYIAVVSVLAAHDVRIDASGGLAALDSRAGGTAWLSPVRAVIFPILVVFWLSFIVRLLLSWRHASIERRQQLKWLLTGCAITLASGVLSIAAVPAAFQSTVDFTSDLGFVALPVCVGIAVLRYRLYDIDRIISRAVAYAIVTGALIGLYAGLVLLTTHGLSFRAPVAVAVSTLAAAALFNPLRQRVQRIVDRRFNRARYDADQIVAAFAARLKNTVDLHSVREDLATVVDQALEPARVFVWTNERE